MIKQNINDSNVNVEMWLSLLCIGLSVSPEITWTGLVFAFPAVNWPSVTFLLPEDLAGLPISCTPGAEGSSLISP